MKIICVGRNYIDHAKELNNPVPSSPLIFMKPPSALLVNSKPFYYPEFSNEIHYEVELVLRICKNGRHIQPEFAPEYYQEIGLGIDLTARDLQAKLKEKGHPWELAKGFDHSAVLGDFIPFTDKMRKDGVSFRLTKNEQQVQKGNSREMIFSFEDIIVYVSRYFRLQIGDLIFTGTPSGVGPIAIGDHFRGYIANQTLLNLEIK